MNALPDSTWKAIYNTNNDYFDTKPQSSRMWGDRKEAFNVFARSGE
jgi:hypothetical protein